MRAMAVLVVLAACSGDDGGSGESAHDTCAVARNTTLEDLGTEVTILQDYGH